MLDYTDLRALDAEFAREVLGRVVEYREVVPHGIGAEDGWLWRHPDGVGHILIEGGWNGLPRYHESQDAAWAGVEKIGLDQVQLKKHGNGWYCECYDPNFPGYRTAHGATPAEALTKACLEAVKCK